MQVTSTVSTEVAHLRWGVWSHGGSLVVGPDACVVPCLSITVRGRERWSRSAFSSAGASDRPPYLAPAALVLPVAGSSGIWALFLQCLLPVSQETGCGIA